MRALYGVEAFRRFLDVCNPCFVKKSWVFDLIFLVMQSELSCPSDKLFGKNVQNEQSKIFANTLAKIEEKFKN